MGDDASRNGSIVDQAWPDMELATPAVGGVADRIRAMAEGGRSGHQRTLQCRGPLQGIATTCPRPECGPGWQAGEVSERGVGPQKKRSLIELRTTTPMCEMAPFENKRIFRTCLTQTGAKISLFLVSQCGGGGW